MEGVYEPFYTKATQILHNAIIYRLLLEMRSLCRIDIKSKSLFKFL